MVSRKKSVKQTGYCVKCKSKQTMKDFVNVVMKNGRHAVKGHCKKCATSMYKITGN